MDADKEAALAASIGRKMDNVLQSLRSRDQSPKRGEQRKSLGSPDKKSPTTPKNGTPSMVSNVTSTAANNGAPSPVSNVTCLTPNNGTSPVVPNVEAIRDKIKEGLSGQTTGTDQTGLSISEDDFEETFSDGSEDEDLLDPGLPVDSMANFILPAKPDGNENVELPSRRREHGKISDQGVEEQTTQRTGMKIPGLPRSSGQGGEETGGEDSSPKKKRSLGKEGGKLTPRNAAGKLMKKLTSGFRGRRSSAEEGQI